MEVVPQPRLRDGGISDFVVRTTFLLRPLREPTGKATWDTLYTNYCEAGEDKEPEPEEHVYLLVDYVDRQDALQQQHVYHQGAIRQQQLMDVYHCSPTATTT